MADIKFAFNNREMIKLLVKRRDYYVKGKYEKAEAKELEMTNLKNTAYDKIIIPSKFYCTFLERVGQ